MTMKRRSWRTAVISAALMATAGAIGVVTAGSSSAATYDHEVWTRLYGPTRASQAGAQQDLDSLTATCRHTDGYGYPDTSSFQIWDLKPVLGLTGYYATLKCYALR